MDLVVVRTEKAKDILFETISVYFADAFWSRLYKLSGAQFTDKKYESLLDAYKDNAERYSRSFGDNESINEKINQYYVEVIIHLTKYFCRTVSELNKSKTINISEKDFADVFTIHVFPEENYTSMGRYDEHKSVAMRKILTKSVSIFAMYFITEICGIASLASNRKEPNESTIFKQIKNKFKEIIINERNDMYNFIVASRSGVDLSKPHIESIPRLIEERMTNEIKKLIQENSDLIERNNKNVELIHELKKAIKTQQKRMNSLERGLSKALTATGKSVAKHVAPVVPDSVVPRLAETSKHTKELEKLTYSGEDFEKDPDELETASTSDAAEEESSGLDILASDE